ncbi:hypothetical protein SPB21_02510 [Leptothoe sp. ISB3NOV94-8A]
MGTKEVLAALTEGKNINELSIAYGIARHGDSFVKERRQDFYRKTIERLLENPNNSRYENVILMFKALGVDIETAISIAANAKLQAEK